MRKLLCAALAAAMLCVPLAGCGSQKAETGGVDYNKYIASKGFFAYTDPAYISCDTGKMSFLEPTLTAPLSPLCAKPDCDHDSKTCSSYVEDYAGVFAYENELYYLYNTDTGLELRRMDADGGNRKTVGALNVKTGADFSCPYQIGCGALLLDLWTWDVTTERQKLYLFSLEHPEQEPVLLFEGLFDTNLSKEENVASFYYSIWDNWVLYVVRTGWGGPALGYYDSLYSLYGYDRTTGETRLLVEDWAYNGAAVIEGSELTWYIPGQEIHKVQLDTGEEQTCAVDFQDAADYYAHFDDRYLYLIDLDGTQGNAICDREGKLLQTLPPDPAGHIMTYAMSTPEYVFFYDTDAAAITFTSCLEKSAIASGTAEYLEVKK